MNDKDKKAYDAWIESSSASRDEIKKFQAMTEHERVTYCMVLGWQSACEYKQKEIDELEKEKDYLCQKMENMREIYKNSEKLQDENINLKKDIDELYRHLKDENDLYKKHLKVYEDENAKLRLVVDHYAQADDVGAYARIILRELEDK